MRTKVIEISVEGDVGTGKSHVMSAIERGLRHEYGPTVQVASRELLMERNRVRDDDDMKKPDLDNTVFVIREACNFVAPDDLPREVRREVKQVLAPICNWKDDYLHVVGQTYICLSYQAVVDALKHAETALEFGVWQKKEEVLKALRPQEFPALVSFRWNMDVRPTLTHIYQEPYPRFFANLTGQPCSGFEPQAPMELKRDSTQLC